MRKEKSTTFPGEDAQGTTRQTFPKDSKKKEKTHRLRAVMRSSVETKRKGRGRERRREMKMKKTQRGGRRRGGRYSTKVFPRTFREGRRLGQNF